MPDLSVIIVNYNVKAFLKNCLLSIEKASVNLSVEVIVVDNASSDGSVELLKKEFPQIKLIPSRKNLGFSKANNLALKEAKGKYLCLLNPDTIVQENSFSEVVSFLEQNPEIGLAGCKILNPDGTLQLPCRRSFPTPWVAFSKLAGLSKVFPKSKLFAKYNLTYLDENENNEVDAVSGSFMLLRRTVYEKIGGLDESFFMYGEDLDYCYRVKQIGYKVFYIHSTSIIHYKGESTKRSDIDEIRIFYNAMHLFVKKHFNYAFGLGLLLRMAIYLKSFTSYVSKIKLVLFPVILDMLIFNLLILTSEWIYNSVSGYAGFPHWSLVYVFTIPAVLFLIVSYFLRTYNIDNFSVSKTISSIFITFFLLSSLTYFFKTFAFSRAILLILFLLLTFSLPVWRIILKVFFRFPKSMKPVLAEGRTLIVGTDQSAIELINKLKNSKTRFFDIIGLIDKGMERLGEDVSGIKIIGSIQFLKKCIIENKISQVIFASGAMRFEDILTIVGKNSETNVHFQIVDSNFNYLIGKKDVVDLEELPFVEINYNLTDPVHKIIKRSFDVCLALILLFTFYPFILIFKLIFNKQNKLLYLPKILTGKYSFVGYPVSSTIFKNFIGKPGLTGLIQVSMIKNLTEEEQIRLNTYYSRNQNIWLDIEIIIKSVQNFLGK